MSSMSKEYLEALYHLATRNSGHRSVEEVDKDFKIVEKALKDYESIDNTEPSEALTYIDAFIEENNNDIKNQDITGFDIDTQAKWVKYLEHKSVMLSTIKQALLKAQEQEKVLEIIKEKDVDIYIFRKCKTVDEYNFKIVHIVGETRELTQKEFELLKEVLE